MASLTTIHKFSLSHEMGDWFSNRYENSFPSPPLPIPCFKIDWVNRSAFLDLSRLEWDTSGYSKSWSFPMGGRLPHFLKACQCITLDAYPSAVYISFQGCASSVECPIWNTIARFNGGKPSAMEKDFMPPSEQGLQTSPQSQRFKYFPTHRQVSLASICLYTRLAGSVYGLHSGYRGGMLWV